MLSCIAALNKGRSLSMRTGHFLKTMLATPSGPGALKVLSFQIACTSCSRVMGVQASAGSGYSKSVGTDKVSGGEERES